VNFTTVFLRRTVIVHVAATLFMVGM